MTLLLERLRQRKLFQWGAAYLAGAWLLLQVLDLVGDKFGWPDVVGRVAIVLLGVGLVAALVLAWYHGEKGHQRVTTLELAMLSVLCIIAGTGVSFVGDAAPETGQATSSPSAPVAVEERSVAVLPFADMSPHQDQEYFSDGITEEILNVLAQVPELRVSARTSSFSFKGKNVPVDSIGRTLRVAHVLEGSVRKAGERIRITAQLVRADNGYHLWSQTYDGDLKDVFAIQDKVARSIAAALRVQIAALGSRAAAPTADVEAYDLYLRARAAMQQPTEASLRRALELFGSALDRDPGYAQAYAGIAVTHTMLADAYVAPLEAYPKALAAALRAVQLDSTLADAQAALGYATLIMDWDVPRAKRHLRRAIELNPSASDARLLYSNLLCMTGKAREGLEHARAGMALDPLHLVLALNYEICLNAAGEYDRVIAEHPRLTAADPGALFLDSWIAAAHRAKGDLSAALAEYERLAAAPGTPPLFGHAIVLARLGRQAEARRILGGLEALAARSYFPPGLIAAVYESLGERERALQWVARGIELHDGISVLVLRSGALPELTPLASDPRYREMLRKAGIE